VRETVNEQPPLVLAMVLADTVVQDLVTGKNTIQGTYHSLGAPAFPFTHPSIVVYVVLTDGYGETSMQLRLVDVDESHPPLFELETTVNFEDPFATLEVVFAQPKVVFPQPGEFRLQLFGAGEPLLERRLYVMLDEGPDAA
jgi:hypothetical protein